ncbi:pyridoxal phosphate-dependent aminotransferase [Roseovarius sp. C7]|uniref:pyridoxal phosphate-dependent aminotransferase n=1 Tax=Roseovarius sp. C7 TaxID=3398643 RepID=UPI0039F69535
MRYSKTITGLTGGGSDGWDIYRKARQMERDGTAVTMLTIGEHDIRTDAQIIDALHRFAHAGHTGYTTFDGEPELKERIAARLTDRTGVATTPENVLIVPGGQGGLYAAHHAVCDPGDTALYIDPYYTTYPGTIRTVGAIPRAIEARPRHGFQPQPEDIAKAVDEGGTVRSLLVNTPNNPTGVVYTRETLDGIAKVCADKGLWLLSDEVYDTQVWNGDHLSPRALPGMAERTLVIGSMSKSHAMTGSRVGWVVGTEEAIEHMANLATHTTYGISGYIQHAAAFALDLGTAFEAQIAEPFRRRRDLVMKQMEGQNAARPIPADGAMYVMVDIRSTGLSGEDFADRLLDRHHVAVMPGESFGHAAAGHVRVALTVADDLLEGAVAKLVALASELATETVEPAR